MKIKKKDVKALKRLLDPECGHSAHYIRTEITKNILPYLFEVDLEVGRWYKNTTTKALFCVTSINSRCFCAYGFNYEDKYLANCESGLIKDDSTYKILATDEEVKKRLIEECIRLGIWNVPIKCLWHKSNLNSLGDFGISYCENELWSRYGMVFKDGVFAKPLNTLTKKQAEEKLNCKIID